MTRAAVLLGPSPADTSAETYVCLLEDSCCSELFVVAEDWGQPDAWWGPDKRRHGQGHRGDTGRQPFTGSR